MSIAFLVTTLVIVATPGTGALYTIAAGLSRGARAGVVAAAGCTLGILPHLLATVTGLDTERREVLVDGLNLPYDHLVIATGATHSYFGQDAWAPFAPGLKRVDDVPVWSLSCFYVRKGFRRRGVTSALIAGKE